MEDMKYFNTDINSLISWLDTEGTAHPGLLETLPQRRAALRALESLDEFFEANPEVEMVGLDRAQNSSYGFDSLVGQYAGSDGTWIQPQANAQGREFLDLVENIERCVMERPPVEVDFCLDRVFVDDPAGEFALFISRQGMEHAVKRCVEVDGPTQQNSVRTSARP